MEPKIYLLCVVNEDIINCKWRPKKEKEKNQRPAWNSMMNRHSCTWWPDSMPVSAWARTFRNYFLLSLLTKYELFNSKYLLQNRFLKKHTATDVVTCKQSAFSVLVDIRRGDSTAAWPVPAHRWEPVVMPVQSHVHCKCTARISFLTRTKALVSLPDSRAPTSASQGRYFVH